MEDFYSRTGERKSIRSIEQEEPWLPWVGGMAVAILLATAIVWSL